MKIGPARWRGRPAIAIRLSDQEAIDLDTPEATATDRVAWDCAAVETQEWEFPECHVVANAVYVIPRWRGYVAPQGRELEAEYQTLEAIIRQELVGRGYHAL